MSLCNCNRHDLQREWNEKYKLQDGSRAGWLEVLHVQLQEIRCDTHVPFHIYSRLPHRRQRTNTLRVRPKSQREKKMNFLYRNVYVSMLWSPEREARVRSRVHRTHVPPIHVKCQPKHIKAIRSQIFYWTTRQPRAAPCLTCMRYRWTTWIVESENMKNWCDNWQKQLNSLAKAAASGEGTHTWTWVCLRCNVEEIRNDLHQLKFRFVLLSPPCSFFFCYTFVWSFVARDSKLRLCLWSGEVISDNDRNNWWPLHCSGCQLW